jgi:putative radical SAM enzyme (TIGR03279 family)
MSDESDCLVTVGYAAPMRVREPQAVIAYVEPDSIADQLGLEPGDRVCRVNGQPPRDIIDYQLWTAVEDLDLTVLTAGGEEIVHSFGKDEHEDLGLGFESELFTPLRTCNNGCLFCFVLQAPPGMRPTVYVKDDDYRLSFLHGHFTTLTNLTEPHFERIVAQQLSPLHVSVHASEPALRRVLLDNAKADAGWDYLVRLLAAGIECHTQVVTCPGVNDGPHLDRTIGDLLALGDGVRSIGVVPVGLTRFQSHPLMRPMTPAEAADTIRRVDAWRASRGESGWARVYAADELYLEAALDLPDEDYYDDFCQLENGVGQTRLFLDEMADFMARLPAAATAPCRVTLVTGEYGALFLGPLVDALNAVAGVRASLAVVRNELFGGNVACAGLLCGRDITAQLGRRESDEVVVLPARAFNDDEVLLDDVGMDELEEALGARVCAAAGLEDLAEACGLDLAEADDDSPALGWGRG